jgi:hypothetical protein
MTRKDVLSLLQLSPAVGRGMMREVGTDDPGPGLTVS